METITQTPNMIEIKKTDDSGRTKTFEITNDNVYFGYTSDTPVKGSKIEIAVFGNLV